MSYTEIHHSRGLPYGGMPLDALNRKLLEETEDAPPASSAETGGYRDYARAEIVDRSPDPPFLESDHHRRDPTCARTVLNLRYADGRGPRDYDSPRHPELFVGFTGNDPRGSDAQPRLELLQVHTAPRTRSREVRMGHNVGHGDYIEADRPKGGTSLEYDKKEIQRRMGANLAWFSSHKQGRPGGRHTAPNAAAGAGRRQGVADGAESLDAALAPPLPPRGGGVLTLDPVRGAEAGDARRAGGHLDTDLLAAWRHTSGDAALAIQRHTAAAGGGRGSLEAAAWRHSTGDADLAAQRHASAARGAGRAPGEEPAAWRHSTGDADLAVQRYTSAARGAGRAPGEEPAAWRHSTGDTALAAQRLTSSAVGSGRGSLEPGAWRHSASDAALAAQRHTAAAGGGRGAIGGSSTGGGRKLAARAEFFLPGSLQGQTVNRRVLAESMTAAAAAARRRAGFRGGRSAFERRGRAFESRPPGRSAPELSRDVARAVRALRLSQPLRPGGRVQDHEGGLLGPSAGQGAPPPTLTAVPLSAHTHAEPLNARLAEAMIRGLRAGSAAQLRGVLGQALAAGRLGSGPGDSAPALIPGGGLAPSDGGSAPRRAVETPIPFCAAAAQLEVHLYGQPASPALPDPVATAKAGGFNAPRPLPATTRLGRSKNPEFRSLTQTPGGLGVRPALVGEHAGPFTGGLSVGDKSIRASALGDGGDDVMVNNAFEDSD